MKGPLAIIIKVLVIFFCVGFTNVSSILKAQNTDIGAIDMPKCMVVPQYTAILPLANNCDWTLLGMEVRGGASPEILDNVTVETFEDNSVEHEYTVTE